MKTKDDEKPTRYEHNRILNISRNTQNYNSSSRDAIQINRYKTNCQIKTSENTTKS